MTYAGWDIINAIAWDTAGLVAGAVITSLAFANLPLTFAMGVSVVGAYFLGTYISYAKDVLLTKRRPD